MDTTKQYEHLQEQFGRARRRWKRTAALSGLALVLLESVGIVTLVILLSLFYGHIPWMRLGLFAAGAAAVAVLAVRHVVRPLLLKITDEQIALYAEEKDQQFEGALITAAEFGRKSGISPLQTRMIQAVVRVADAKAERVRLTSLVRLARLRKYGVAALVCLGVYVVMCVAFPTTVGRHVVAALQPWRVQPPGPVGPDGRALPPGLTAQQARMLEPISFRLSAADVRLPRGEDFRLEVQLSRPPAEGKPVLLQFRAVGDPQLPGPWQPLPMEEIQKLYGYARRLESVSEDMEFRVAAEAYVSPTHRIAVFDRIELRAVEITTKYPAYLQFPDRVDLLSNGDVSAPIGSAVSVRIVVNTELAGGKLVWDDGAEQKLAVDAGRKSSAVASFPVEKARRYSFEVTDIDGQVAKSLGPSEVFALTDNPPILDLIDPAAEIETHPLGEVQYVAKVTDDFGVDKAELVYLRLTGGGEATGRVPMELKRPSGEEVPLPEVADATLRWMLETVEPPVRPGDVISWYLEARDRKPDNPPAVSDLHMIVVLPFELWGAYQYEAAEAPGPVMSGEVPYTLAELLVEVWAAHRVQGTVPEKEYNAKCQNVADMMVHPDTGQVYDFGTASLPKHPTPRQVEAAKRAQVHATQAYEALLKHDTALAARHLRLGIAELVAAGITETEALGREGEMPAGGMQATGGAAAPQQQASRLMEIFADLKAELEAELGSKIEGNLGAAKAAAQARQAVEGIRSQQQGIINQAKELARSAAGDAAKGAEAGKLGQGEQSLAGKARATAGALKRDKAAGGQLDAAAGKIDGAAAAMRAAAGHFAQGEVSQAVTKATEADQLLGQAEGDLREKRFDRLAEALAEAESAVEAMLRDQGDIRRGTEGVDQATGGKELTPKQKRELKKLSYDQVKLQARLEAFAPKMDKLKQWASDSQRSDTTKHIEAADRVMKRTQPAQKMANAVVELTGFKAKPAAAEQKEAENGLSQTLAELQAAGDTLAATREESLRRALREAKGIQEGVEQIAQADQAGKGGDQAGKGGDAAGKGGDQGGKGGDAASKGGDAAGKGGDQAGKGGDAAGKGGDQSGDQSGQGGEESGKGSSGGQGGAAAGSGGLPSPQQRRALGKDIAAGVRRLTRQLGARDFGLSQDVPLLQRVAQDVALEAKLVTDPATQKRLQEIMARVTDKLEAELEATAKAKRVLSAQQEECPPQYRHLVNKYYEALSRRRK